MTWDRFDPALTMSFDLIAFVINYCQTPDVGIQWLRAGYQSLAPGFLFVRTFVNPGSRMSAVLHLELAFGRLGSFESATGKPVNLVLQYHIRHLAWAEAGEDIVHQSHKPFVVLHRQQARIRGSQDTVVPLLERVSSVSLSILNTQDAPYTIVALVDDAQQFMHSMNPNLAYLNVAEAGDSVFPDVRGLQGDGINGLRPGGRCAGLTQYMRMVLAVSARWEADWLRAIRAIDKAANFRVSQYLCADHWHNADY